ncbi:MAG: hypothetical protein PHV20_10245 [Bacteroidales bacterium]|nr:hypothetical protein [Bacteroidales bacterium]
MKISVVKSGELNEIDWTQITSGFNESFSLNKQPVDLINYYCSNEFGYSFHAICRNDDDEIIAHSSIFPYHYLVNNEKFIFGLSGGTFVLKAYRKEAFLYVDLLEELKEFVKSKGVVLTYGVSNENSFGIAVKLLGSIHLKDLSYYAIPVALTKVFLKKKFIFVDAIFRIILIFWCFGVKLYSLIWDVFEIEKAIRLDLTDKVYERRFGMNYKRFHSKELSGVYRIVNEAGLNAAYLMDFRRNGKRSLLALNSLISYILKNEKVDIILFVGELSFFQNMLVKIPRKFEPQRLPLTYDLLINDNRDLNDFISKPENWDFSLLNFDAR